MKSDNFKKYSFLTDQLTFSVETKSEGDKKYYITGYITTKDRDILNDIVTEEAMTSMIKQLKERPITMDVEHEVYLKKNNSIIPVAKIVEAKKDSKGIWVKAEINKHNSRFKEIWESVKHKFITAFSIMYKPVDYVHKMVDGVKTRMLKSIDLLNVTLTGVPVNPEARIDNVMVKSLAELDNKMEVKTMAEEEQKKPDEAQEKKPEDKKPEEKTEETKSEEKDTEVKNLMAEIKNFKDRFDSIEKTINNLKTETKSLFEKLEKPMLKALNTGSMPQGEKKGATDVDEESEEKKDAEVKNTTEKSKESNPLDLI